MATPPTYTEGGTIEMCARFSCDKNVIDMIFDQSQAFVEGTFSADSSYAVIDCQQLQWPCRICALVMRAE